MLTIVSFTCLSALAYVFFKLKTPTNLYFVIVSLDNALTCQSKLLVYAYNKQGAKCDKSMLMCNSWRVTESFIDITTLEIIATKLASRVLTY